PVGRAPAAGRARAGWAAGAPAGWHSPLPVRGAPAATGTGAGCVTHPAPIFPTRPGSLASVNHTLSSGPAAIPTGKLFSLRPAVNSLITPPGVIRPIRPGAVPPVEPKVPSPPGPIPRRPHFPARG